MGIKLAQVTFDSADAPALARFWADLVGGSVADGATEDMAMVPGSADVPMLLFLRVPEGKTAKNRVHLDLGTADLEAEKARILGLGAAFVHDKEEWGFTWTTFLDPEGNEFCVGVEPEADE